MLNDFKLNEYCNMIADEIAQDADNIHDALDLAAEAADGSEYCIYYAKAHELCRTCNTDNGEDFVADCYSDVPMTYDDMACRIAYGEIERRISHRLEVIFEGAEEAA